MKTNVFLILFSLFSVNHTESNQSTVFLCDSPNGARYHWSKDCRGLSNCKHQIIKVSLDEARKRGKTLCGYEK